MKIEKQVCTLAQAKQLKELGINQNGLFSFFGDEEFRLRDNGREGAEFSQWIFIQHTIPVNNQQGDWRDDVRCKTPIASAFTSAELGEMLPVDFTTSFRTYSEWQSVEYRESGHSFSNEFLSETEAVAKADMLIWLLESKKLPAHDCNTRLKD